MNRKIKFAVEAVCLMSVGALLSSLGVGIAVWQFWAIFVLIGVYGAFSSFDAE